MLKYIMIASISLVCILAVGAGAQENIQHPDTEPWSSKVPYSQLNASNYNPETDPHIDMYLSSWKDAMPVHTHGALVERVIFTRGDGNPLNPPDIGAVLEGVKRFSHATLRTHTSTPPMTLSGEQEVYYVLSGSGTISSAGLTRDIFPGITFLVPESLEYSIHNTGDEAIMMYLVVEPVPDGFRPNKAIILLNEATTPVTSTNDHWVNVTKTLFGSGDGLAVISEIMTVSIPPRAMSQPFSYIEGVEAVYSTIEGDPQFLSGKQMRNLPPGSAYMVVPDGKTPHSNINLSNDTVKLFYFGSGSKPQ